MSSTAPRSFTYAGDVIVPVRSRGGERLRDRARGEPRQVSAARIWLARSSNPLGGRGIGGTAVGRIVLESAIVRRIVRRRDHDAVGESRGAAAVVREDGVRERGRGRVAEVVRRPSPRRRWPPSTSSALAKAGSESACVSLARKSGPSAPLRRTIFADRLGDGQDVTFVERAIERRCRDDRRFRKLTRCAGTPGSGFGVVGGDQAGNVHQHGGCWGLASKRIEGHDTKVRALPPFTQSC